MPAIPPNAQRPCFQYCLEARALPLKAEGYSHFQFGFALQMCTNISHFANIFSRRSNFAAFLFDFNPNHPRKPAPHHARRPHLLLLPAPGPVLSGPVCAWRTVGKGGSGTITPPAGMRAMPGAGEGIFAGSGEGSSSRA